MRRLALAVALSHLISLTVRAQLSPNPSAANTITVTGRVLADDTGNSISNARVTMTQQPKTAGRTVLTDGDGRFALTALPPLGRVVASKTGFAAESVTPASADRPLEIRLRRAAVISGRVIDEFGQPIVGGRIVIDPVATSPGAPGASKFVETDDHGEYRVGGLVAGDFVIAVRTINANATAHGAGTRMEFSLEGQETYFPGTTKASDARPVHVDFGEERANVDMVLAGDQAGGEPFGIFGGAPGTKIHDHPATDPAIIRGQVVDTDGRGLARAFVRLSPKNMSLPVRAIRAESDGRFEFADLAAGTFRVAAYVPGYTPPRDDALVLPGMPMMGGGPTVTVSAGQVRDAVQIKMSRLGVLAGRVLDEHGDPVEGARVQLLTIKYRGGRRRLVDAGFAARTTNDRGEYRLHDVPNGRYIVSVSIGAVGSNDIPGYTRSYFPSTANPGDAQFVALAETDRIGVDVSLVPTRTALVSGRIYNAAGEPSTGGHVELRPSSRSASAAVSVPVGARLLPDGAFEFPNVEPGEYVVEADRGRSNQSTEGEFGTTLVTVVDSDVTNVVVQMSAGSSITGRFVFDTADPNKRPARDAIELVATGVDPDRTPSRTASAAIHDDWTFMMAGINGPRRLDLLRLPPEWMLKQVHVRGIDITDQPIAFGKQDQSLADVEVALTDRVTTLSGRIVDDNGHPAAGSHVIVFSTDRTRWYPLSRFLREMPTWEDGIFKITGLPPESYYVAVVARLDEGDEAWQDPAYLDTLTLGSTTITIGEGQRQLLNLRLPTP